MYLSTAFIGGTVLLILLSVEMLMGLKIIKAPFWVHKYLGLLFLFAMLGHSVFGFLSYGSLTKGFYFGSAIFVFLLFNLLIGFNVLKLGVKWHKRSAYAVLLVALLHFISGLLSIL